jgi:hypothetical protein
VDASGAVLDTWTVSLSELTNPSVVPVDPSEQPDFNGDGYADLAIGNPDEDLSGSLSAGAALVLNGSSAMSRSLGNVYWNSDTDDVPGVSESYDFFGSALTYGDFNGDGYSDIAIGGYGEDISGGGSQAGMVTVVYGSAEGLDATTGENWYQDQTGVTGDSESNDYFGYALASGDFDNDGNDDLAVGVPNEDLGSDNGAGMVVVIYGSTSGLDAVGTFNGRPSQGVHQDNITSGYSAEDNDHCGETVAAGDFDGDGYHDLVFGCPDEDLNSNTEDDAGAIIVVYGSNTGLQLTNVDTFSQNTSGIGGVVEQGDQFGAALAVGDINGDGKDDLAVGIPYENTGDITGGDSATDAGRVSVIFGNAVGLFAGGADIFHMSDIAGSSGDQGYSYFGRALTMGDFNGDGYDDVAVGADNYFSNDEGAVGVLAGSASGISTAGSWFIDPTISPWGLTQDQHFGACLSALDTNADGRDELAVCAPDLNTNGIWESGAVVLLKGTVTGPSFVGSQFWHSDRDEIAGANESGDGFGTALAN